MSGPTPQQIEALRRHGKPYPPTTSLLGGTPSKGVDVPVASVFLVLFIIGAVAHMTIFQINKRRSHKFLMSGMMFGFCMTRITSQVMRIVWAYYPANVSIAIAAQIFVAAGVVLIFAINLIFAQRLIRSMHPELGWHPAFSWTFKILLGLIVVMLLMLVTSTVYSFFTLDQKVKVQMHDIQLAGLTYFMVISFLPIPLMYGALLLVPKGRPEAFGSGHMRHKIAILIGSAILLSTGATFRCATNYKSPRPLNDPPGYFSKACFWLFNFTIEIIVVYLYVLVRIDQRFFVPNGSKGPGWYSGAVKGDGMLTDKEKKLQQPPLGADDMSTMSSVPPMRPASILALRRSAIASPTSWILSEEEAFDDMVESDIGGFVPRRQTSFRAKETWFESRETMVEQPPPDVPDVGKAI